jgi:predicted ATP-dependent endonuclease of OLD family
MKIKSLRISNIWSFKYVENIEDAQSISFDEDFNILIGQNGSGKSTVLEVINFIFKRALFSPYVINRDSLEQKSILNAGQRRGILLKSNDANNYNTFRLEKNYDYAAYPQSIRVVIEIDDVDKTNIRLLSEHNAPLSAILSTYTTEPLLPNSEVLTEYQIDIELNSVDRSFTVQAISDAGYDYLVRYNLYKEAIELHNEENLEGKIDNLEETFALVGSYRNYSAYSSSVTLTGNSNAARQIQSFRTSEQSRSASALENSEPTVFSLVRLQMAKRCFDLIPTHLTSAEAESAANSLALVKSINETIKIVNLRVEIKLTDLANWGFSFLFVDLKRNKAVNDISSLSAGQKAIVHLVFEAYGRGNLKGGLVIIDEPELHLHYQFQYEYLRVIEKLNTEQRCQYILVTHSESLISSTTIKSVIRFSLDDDGYTNINKPTISTKEKSLVKILDIQRSTHAFFAGKVLLVEGESDVYFFNAALDYIEGKLKLGIVKDIAVLSINGKTNDEWRPFFHSFGLKTYSVFDLDFARNLFYSSEASRAIKSAADISNFVKTHPEVTTLIEAEYANNIFILREGDLETYLGVEKNPSNVIYFCQNELATFMTSTSNSKVAEIKMILSKLIGISADEF